jgi:hypothetical protein
VAVFSSFTEELLNFLLMRVDETGLELLVVHEPNRMSAGYLESGGGRCETRVASFTGCAACSHVAPGKLFPSYLGIDVEAWPCLRIRSMAQFYADDPDFAYGWGPDYAVLVSGMLVHQTADRRWPHQPPSRSPCVQK